MFPKVNLVETTAWKALQQHHNLFNQIHIKDLFSNDAERFSKFSLCVKDILFDYSKNIITENTLELLLQLAEECKLKDAIEAMFSGEK